MREFSDEILSSLRCCGEDRPWNLAMNCRNSARLEFPTTSPTSLYPLLKNKKICAERFFMANKITDLLRFVHEQLTISFSLYLLSIVSKLIIAFHSYSLTWWLFYWWPKYFHWIRYDYTQRYIPKHYRTLGKRTKSLGEKNVDEKTKAHR